MKSREVTKDVRALALLGSLQSAGVPVLAVRPPTAPSRPTIIDLEDNANDATVDQVVAAHDAAAIDAAAAQAAQEDAQDSDLARTMYAILLADAARLEDTAQAMTIQVVRNHLARTDKAVAAILRRLRRVGIV